MVAETNILEIQGTADAGVISRTSHEGCYHCGTRCAGSAYTSEDKRFCCNGCLSVYELLTANGLGEFYEIDAAAGVRVQAATPATKFAYLDEPNLRRKIVNFADDRTTRVTFLIPAIHCSACIWLLENLFRMRPGIGRTEVNFLRKEAVINFETSSVKLSQVVSLLASLGYEPELKLSDLDKKAIFGADRKLWIQLGLAGFAFGNNMLFSIALYLGVDGFSGPGFQKLVGWISFALALPVLLYSSQDYFRLAWLGLKHRLLTIEFPIAIGILVIFAQSTWEVSSATGEGYFDSFAGLLFFLLCGRLFQQKTFDRLSFERDFKSFFPLSVTRKTSKGEETTSLAQISPGDSILVRNGELIPADSKLVSSGAFIDYSFVTGESEPVEKAEGDHLYAGGRQVGETIEIQTIKLVSQSYLTSLWNQPAFGKSHGQVLDTLINRYSQRFTIIIMTVAMGAGIYWALVNPTLSLKAFTSVLIVACPCALALAAPFTLGTALRMLGRADIFVKNPSVIETLARVDTVVFDKTGTLTGAGAGSIQFLGKPLTLEERGWVHGVARHSTHPAAVRITEAVAQEHDPVQARSFMEVPGCGVEANVSGQEITLGSAAWLQSHGVAVPETGATIGSVVHVAVNWKYRGTYLLTSALRPNVKELLASISSNCKVALLSGDNEKERPIFTGIFGSDAELRFNQTPAAKLEFIRSLQEAGARVMMVGDGLNDAGALKQSDVGVAVVEKVGAFSPASDIILTGRSVRSLASLLEFSKRSVSIVRLSFAISSLYNIVGIAIAAKGALAPIVCAVLMPLSSISVVVFACAATSWQARRSGLAERQPV